MDDVRGVEPLDEATEIVAEEIRALILGGERATPENAPPVIARPTACVYAWIG